MGLQSNEVIELRLMDCEIPVTLGHLFVIFR